MEKALERILENFNPEIMESAQNFSIWIMEAGRKEGLFFNASEDEKALNYAIALTEELFIIIFSLRLLYLLEISRDEENFSLITYAVRTKCQEKIGYIPMEKLSACTQQVLKEILILKKQATKFEKAEDRGFFYFLLRSNVGAIGDIISFFCTIRAQVN